MNDLTGQRFHKLVVVKDSGQRNAHRDILWECTCVCGATVLANSRQLRRGSKPSCPACKMGVGNTVQPQDFDPKRQVEIYCNMDKMLAQMITLEFPKAMLEDFHNRLWYMIRKLAKEYCIEEPEDEVISVYTGKVSGDIEEVE